MARKFYCPPQPATGAGTFSDDLVGFQLVQGGGLTQGNFEFTTSIVEKTNRTFEIGSFSQPITLDTLKIESVLESKKIVAKNYQVYPNFDLSDVTNFTLYGSLSKRLSVAVQGIINFFPASFESNFYGFDQTTGATATNIIFNYVENVTTFDIDVARLFNPFDVDFSDNAQVNVSSREIEISVLRNFTDEYRNYALFTTAGTFDIIFTDPTPTITSGTLTISVNGNPFSGASVTYDNLVIRPNDYNVELLYSEKYDEVQRFLLNRLISPIYTAIFDFPQENENGQYYIQKKPVTWPLDGVWNLDIRSILFENYLQTLSEIGSSIDEYKTNLISRFLTTGSLKDFDTVDQKAEKMFQIYGRSFDETKKFIDALAFMNSVNYVVANDIPSQLLKNLSMTLGWKTNVSPISEDDFLDSVFGNTSKIEFPGYSKPLTPNELNYQFYRNLILNSAFLFKSKGTRKSIESLMRLIGAPEALIEFNEHVYLVDQVINMSRFEILYAQISGGTAAIQTPILDPSNTFSILGVTYTGFTSTYEFFDVNTTLDDYPVDKEGFPSAPEDTEDFYFQKGAGWYESTPQHRSPEIINTQLSVFTGANVNVQTDLEPFTYGQKYLDRFRKFPLISDGFKLTRVIDNKKSWLPSEKGLRRHSNGGFNAYYYSYDERLVMNVKNIDLFLNPAQGLAYDVWVMSNQYDYPIPQSGMSYPYPSPYGIDWTIINPQPKSLTFFEFAQTFWRNMINVRNRQFITDGKTGGYPTLQSIWWAYLDSGSAINVPNDNFTYQNMIDYVVGIGDYWIRLVDQMIPATTIWNGGLKYENSQFHRDKFVWRRQAGCQIIPIPCIPCELTGPIFPVDCFSQIVDCQLYPWQNQRQNQIVPIGQNFTTILSQVVNNYLSSIGVLLSDCIQNSLTSSWYIVLELDGTEIVRYNFFNGYGFTVPNNSVPTITQYIQAINNSFQNIYEYGIYYSLIPTTATSPDEYNQIKFITLNCQDFTTKSLEFKIDINFNISCN
jgi:hypothetical protein